jgi:hypothetical protein
MAATDVVYVLGSGSNWKNNEIRFSLRSLEKNLMEFRKIWVVGEKPEFLKNVHFVPHPDELLNNADGNIIKKVLRICQEKSLTNNFLFINDDHLVLKPIIAVEIKPYHKGDLQSFTKEFFELNFWRGRLFRTKNILLQKGFSTFHFDCHIPMVINKHKFPQVISQFDFERNIGYTMKSLYGNVMYPDAPLMNGEKVTLFRPYTIKDLKIRTSNALFASFNDDGLTPMLKEWLLETFADPSKFEDEKSMDPSFEIISWLRSEEKDYNVGKMLFDRYGKAKKAKKYFSKSETNARYAKLEHKLKELLNYL